MIGASGARPNMGVRPDPPANEIIDMLTFCEIIKEGEKGMRKIGLMGIVFLFLGMMPGFILGAEIDGSRPVICAIMETFQLAPGQECLRGTAESLNLPYFFQINFQGKRLLFMREGKEETTKIERAVREGGMWIMQGVELRGWTLTVSESSGKMVLSAAGEAESFVSFGVCTVK
jgi:hypothetical protein